MRRILSTTLGLAVGLLASGAASAQATSPWSLGKALDMPSALHIVGSTRLRYETIGGQPRAGFNASDSLTNLRTTLLVEYHAGPLRIGAELYDSRAYGGDRRSPITTNEVNSFEPAQAYVALDLPGVFGAKTSAAVEAGRFLLNIGSRRLVAADDYRNTINSYTGLRADIAAQGIKATLIYVLPNIRLPDDLTSVLDNKSHLDRETFDLVLWGGTAIRDHAIGATGIELSFYRLRERDAPDRPTRDRHLSTIGGRLIRDPVKGGWDHELEGFYQFGQISDGLGAAARSLDVSAWFLHADIGRSLAGSWRPHVSFEFDVASGDRPGGHYGRFDTLFGMRRAELAPPGLYNAVGRANFVTPGLRIEVTPSKALDGFMTYRPLWLASKTDAFSTSGVRDATGRSGSFAGHQFDARVRYWLVQDALRLEADGVLLKKRRFLETAPNISSGRDTAYLSLNATAFF